MTIAFAPVACRPAVAPHTAPVETRLAFLGSVLLELAWAFLVLEGVAFAALGARWLLTLGI